MKTIIMQVGEGGCRFLGNFEIESKTPPVRIDKRTIKVDGVMIVFEEEIIIY